MATTTPPVAATARRAGPRIHWRKVAGKGLMHVVLIAASIYVLFPLWWAFSSSLKGVKELYGVDPTLWPAHPSLANYAGTLFDMSKFDIVEQMRNSVVVTGGTVVLTALLATLAGYGFARIRFRGRDLIFIIFLLSLFIPQSGGLMAAYELMSFLHLRNSLLGLILAFSSGLTVPVFIMRQSFQALPNELDDAARIDGATRWQFFWRVGVPMVSAGITVVCIFTFISAWGEYLFTFTMEDTQSLYTLAVAVAQTEIPNAAFVDVPAFSAYGASAAIAIMAAAPALLIFILLQKWFVRGLAEGALKF
jgi:ABC-type glycerol-3-phosphate transport system permease component